MGTDPAADDLGRALPVLLRPRCDLLREGRRVRPARRRARRHCARDRGRARRRARRGLRRMGKVADPRRPAAARREHGRGSRAVPRGRDAAARGAQLRRDRLHRAPGARVRGLPMILRATQSAPIRVTVRRAASAAGVVALLGAWAAAAAGRGMTMHMIAHMTSVAVAAPLIAFGLSGTALDPAQRWPRVVAPLAMSIVELVVVWGWHAPAARALAAGSAAGLAAEQISF